ncbi:hypothetical protein [Hyphomicrobium sp.]|uniref:hypothetical protein n=1 Tax=Hyphomicrobium sp. TaxID=82 RepID=UPI002E354C31|nr:hypothetical protein [Hyphomicrobium sp.]
MSWSNPNHYVTMSNGLHQVLMMVLAKQQGLRNDEHLRILKRQQARIEQRMNVLDRAAWRERVELVHPMDDATVVYGLEKMADALEEGSAAWIRAKEDGGSNVFAGTMLGVAVGFAASIRGHRASERFSVGPFGALSKVSQLMTEADVLLEMQDLPALAELINKARQVPSGQEIVPGNIGSAPFVEALLKVISQTNARIEGNGLAG